MKKKIFSISASLLLLTMLVIPADATNVDVTDPDAMLPVDIILDQDNREIRKVYDLSPNTDPSTLPMQQFERDGLLYECTDVLREVIIGSETQVITQTETVESDKKDMETILSLLPQEKEVTTEEDFSGTLHYQAGDRYAHLSKLGKPRYQPPAKEHYGGGQNAQSARCPMANG